MWQVACGHEILIMNELAIENRIRDHEEHFTNWDLYLW